MGRQRGGEQIDEPVVVDSHPDLGASAGDARPEIADGHAPRDATGRHLDASGAGDVTLIVTGGLRTDADFIKALALGADAVAVSNAALQAIGCLGMRACHTNNCPVGIATQKDHLRARLIVEASAQRLTKWFEATVGLMQVLARACGHGSLSDFGPSDLTTWKPDVARLTGVAYSGIGPLDGATR